MENAVEGRGRLTYIVTHTNHKAEDAQRREYSAEGLGHTKLEATRLVLEME